jgi:phenylpyruvate tautomerase PptA (4-oxalocrotonate tautomerase family)
VPLITIDLLEGRSDDDLDAIAHSVHEAMVETLDVPEHDRFQIITEHAPRTLRFDRDYLRGGRTDAFVLVRVTLAAGRTTEAKRAFYARLADLLSHRVHLDTADLAVTLVENAREDWSFGRGEVSYLDIPREDWR